MPQSFKEIFISTDVEADGPIPGPYSMLSLGSAAYLPDKTLVDTFSINLELLPGATGHPDTMDWWQTQPEAWAACRTSLESPESAMTQYSDWLTGFKQKPIFVAYPVAFDFMFVDWYLHKFAGSSPFGYSALDIKTYGMAMLKKHTYSGSTKRHYPKHWFDDLPHTHIALDDAIEQGAMFINMYCENLMDDNG